MFKINLSPQVRDIATELELVADGSRLILNGEILDLSVMNDGDEIPSSAIDHDYFNLGSITYVNGVYELTMLFPISPTQTDESSCFPDPVIVTQDGKIDLPPQLII